MELKVNWIPEILCRNSSSHAEEKEKEIFYEERKLNFKIFCIPLPNTVDML